ncbi:MAG TPA: esterase-like activity of phytase family protein, partial [Rhodospirillales bacterium]|nr:esterase-like activity of phytase family protein [Rhodospirillales bacterium]
MRIRLLVAAIAGVSCCLSNAPARADAIEVRTRPLVLDAKDPHRTRVGRLEWRGGLELTSAHRRFGGLSSLRVTPDGSRFTAVSDEGWRLDGSLLQDTGGRLVGLDATTLVPLLSRRGRPLPDIGKHESDAESLVREAGGGFVIGFEGDHRIVRYPPEGR